MNRIVSRVAYQVTTVPPPRNEKKFVHCDCGAPIHERGLLAYVAPAATAPSTYRN